MSERSCPEYLAFQRNYDLLLNLRHGIESIARKAFATELISTDLRIKCLDKSLEEAERTRCLIDALQEMTPHRPQTLHKFANILNETSSFEYIAKILLTSFEEAKEDIEMQESKSRKRFSLNHVTASTDVLSSDSHSKLELQNTMRSIFVTPEAAVLPGKANLITGGTFNTTPRLPSGNLMLCNAANFPGNSILAKYRGTDRQVTKMSTSGPQPNISHSSIAAFSKFEEGRSFRATTPPAIPTHRPVLERRISRTPPPDLSHRKMSAPSQVWKRQNDAGNSSNKGDDLADSSKKHIQVKVEPATPIHHAQRKETRNALTSNDLIESQEESRDFLETKKQEMARMSSTCSTDSNDFHTACTSFSEEELAKIEAAGQETPKETQDKEFFKKVMEKIENQEKAKEQCQDCIKLRRHLSRSEEKINKLKKQLSNHKEQTESQVLELKCELFQTSMNYNATLEGYKQYALELERKVQSLEVKVESEKVAKQEALMCVENLLHMAQRCSSNLPPCNPNHNRYQPPTQPANHTRSTSTKHQDHTPYKPQIYSSNHTYYSTMQHHQPPRHDINYTPMQHQDHTHHQPPTRHENHTYNRNMQHEDGTQNHNGSTNFPIQMTQGGLPLAQSTTGLLDYADHQND